MQLSITEIIDRHVSKKMAEYKKEITELINTLIARIGNPLSDVSGKSITNFDHLEKDALDLLASIYRVDSVTVKQTQDRDEDYICYTLYFGQTYKHRIKELEKELAMLRKNSTWVRDPSCGCNMQRCPKCEDPGYISS